MGNPRAVCALTVLVRRNKPVVVSLIETLMDVTKTEDVHNKIGITYSFAVNKISKVVSIKIILIIL